MISSMRLDGSTACMAIDGATDTEVFRAYVGEVHIPTLRECDINLTPHKNEETLALIEKAGASVLFLPPYSPDLNPSEKMWSKVKAALRSLEAITHEELLTAIAKALSLVSASDARKWFSAFGYIII